MKLRKHVSHFALAGLFITASCDDPMNNEKVYNRPQVADSAPFKYHGYLFRFPKGSVNARIEQGEGSGPWARLVPEAPSSRDPIDARYDVDLGRSGTGRPGPLGYSLGYNIYHSDALHTDISGGYMMYCKPHGSRTPAFNCAVLLRTVPLAAIELRDTPTSADMARSLVDEAEDFLKKSLS